MTDLSLRTAGFTDSVIRRMTRISNQYGAVNLSQGFPDFEPPKEILERLAQVTKEDFHQYATTWGSQNFRDAVAAKQKHFMGYDIDPNSEIVVTCGSTEAMMAAMLSVTNPGDKVIVFSPFYENYGADAVLSGAEPIYVPLVPPEYSFDADVLEAAFRQHPKALILCNPSNPCGKVFTREELQIIADLAEKYDTYVITDEVYEHILYAPNRHVYFSTLPGMRKRTICCSSLSKTYSITGWRLGYSAAPAPIAKAIQMIQDHTTSNVCTFAQYGGIEALTGDQSFISDMRDEYDMRRQYVYSRLSAIPNVSVVEPQGAFYFFVDTSKLGLTSLNLCDKLLERYKVAAVPGIAFGNDKGIRISYCTTLDILKEALDRFEEFCKAH